MFHLLILLLWLSIGWHYGWNLIKTLIRGPHVVDGMDETRSNTHLRTSRRDETRLDIHSRNGLFWASPQYLWSAVSCTLCFWCVFLKRASIGDCRLRRYYFSPRSERYKDCPWCLDDTLVHQHLFSFLQRPSLQLPSTLLSGRSINLSFI